MNPGKLIDAIRVYDPLENLRFSVSGKEVGAPGFDSGFPGGRSSSLAWLETSESDEPTSASVTAERIPTTPRALETHFVFAKDDGSFTRAAERCVGVGACRKTEGGVMCPSYRATGLEQHSTRGRARLLWEMLAGALQAEGFQSESVHEALDLCLSCKACKTECPVQVDMAAYKSEFLAQRYKGRLHPLHHYIFGFADKLARWGSLAPSLTNALLTGPLTSPLLKRIVGIAQERELPGLAPQSFQKIQAEQKMGAPGLDSETWKSKSLNKPQSGRAAQLAPPQVGEAQLAAPQVLLWADTWNNYYHPQTLVAAETVLTRAGFRVQSPQGHICCGRPLYDFGLLGAARSYLARVLERMAPQINTGLPFIFLEPSCASVFKDELGELFPNNPRACKLKDLTWLLADFLAEKVPGFGAGTLQGEYILLHGHCHHKAVFGGPASEIAVLRRAGAQVDAIDATCCGMAGPFGFEADKYQVSRAIAKLSLLPAVESADPATVLVADGFSCREQISQLGHKQAVHFAEVLAKGSLPTALP
jgi:Fe-S oxidoreductase